MREEVRSGEAVEAAELSKLIDQLWQGELGRLDDQTRASVQQAGVLVDKRFSAEHYGRLTQKQQDTYELVIYHLCERALQTLRAANPNDPLYLRDMYEFLSSGELLLQDDVLKSRFSHSTSNKPIPDRFRQAYDALVKTYNLTRWWDADDTAQNRVANVVQLTPLERDVWDTFWKSPIKTDKEIARTLDLPIDTITKVRRRLLAQDVIKRHGTLHNAINLAQSLQGKASEEWIRGRDAAIRELMRGANVRQLSQKYHVADKVLYRIRQELVAAGKMSKPQRASREGGYATKRLVEFLELQKGEFTPDQIVKEMNFKNMLNLLQAVRRWEKSGKIEAGTYEAFREKNRKTRSGI